MVPREVPRKSSAIYLGPNARVDWLDFNGDSVINAFDFGQLRNRFGGSVP
jgi:hypothetical protein